jgi:hypothetical protein
VRLVVQNGRIVAPHANAAFWLSSVFTSGLRGISSDQAKSGLENQLDKVLAAMPPPYQAALAPGETDAGLKDPLTEAVRKCSGSIQDYVTTCMQPWSDANRARGQPADILVDGSDFYKPLVASTTTSALAFSEELSSLDEGVAIFFVANPFASARVPIQLPFTTSPAQQRRIRDLRRALAPLDGTLWDPAAVQSRLMAYYKPLGLSAQIITQGSNEVVIDEGFRVARIMLTVGDVTDQDIDKILWIVLSQTDFDKAMLHRPKMDPQGKADAIVNFEPDLGYQKGDEPYELTERIQDQQLMLAEIGFTALVLPSNAKAGTTQRYHDLRVQRAATQPPQKSATPKPTPAAVDAHGAVVSSVSPPGARGTQAAQSAEGEKLDRPWFIGGGLIYKPGQALGVFGLLNRSRISYPLANSSLSVEAGYPFGTARSLNYSADYIAFNQLHERFSLRLTGSTDIQMRRYLLGEKLDEHRTGGFGQLVWEPFHDLDGGLLQVVGEMRRSTVTLQSNTAIGQKLNLSTFRTTGLYQFQSELSQYPRSLRIEPFVEAGLGLSAAEAPFAVGGIDANYHQNIGVLAPDFTLHFQNATSGAPLVELPSFGGAEVLRGFRTDDAIGRRYLTLQSELWLPVPGIPTDSAPGASATGLSSILSKLRLAPFADVGGAWQTVSSKPGLRVGPGLGLRLDMTAGLSHIVFRLDWAYGFGDAATGGSRGKFYFSLVSNLPF